MYQKMPDKETILKVYSKYRNAFLLGCGKETMMYHFVDVTGVWYDKNDLRKAITLFFVPVYEEKKYTRFEVVE